MNKTLLEKQRQTHVIFYVFPHVEAPVLADQQELTNDSSVRTQDVI